MNTLFAIILATFIISLISLIGIITLAIKQKLLEKILLILVSLSAGTLIGGAFLHLIPEAIELSKSAMLYVVIGFILFFLIEKILHWRHCHKQHCAIHIFAYINLLGDFFHNFLDGLIIAASFIASIPLGISTSIAIAVHEIPQEIGDFGVLIYAGMKKSKAIFLNFLVALTAVAGGIVGFLLSSQIQTAVPFIISIAAGGFIYLAASDLIPEIRKDRTAKSLLYLLVFIIGVLIMYLLKFIG